MRGNRTAARTRKFQTSNVLLEKASKVTKICKNSSKIMKKTQFYVGKLASKKHFATICQLRRVLILALATKTNREKTKQTQKSTKTNNPT